MGIVVFLATRSFIVGACIDYGWQFLIWPAIQPEPNPVMIGFGLTLDAINKWVRVESMLPIRPVIIRFLPLAFKSRTVCIE